MSDNQPPQSKSKPRVSNHTVLRQIGHSLHGDVWLACDVTGAFRAVKVVRRDQFQYEASYDWGYHDLTKHEPVSVSHNGLIDILQTDQNEEQGYFFYVMELGDDDSGVTAGKSADDSINSDTYQPRTLQSDIQIRRLLPWNEVMKGALNVCSALGHLHLQKQICPGIKSADIVFVNGTPKIARVARSADSGAISSIPKTEGFTPPEGYGTTRADVFSLGKVIYELATGIDCRRFPEWPANQPELAALKGVLLKACASNPQKRYGDGQALYADLLAVQSGRAPQSSSSSGGMKIAVAAVVVVGLTLGGFFLLKKSAAPQPKKTEPVAVAPAPPTPPTREIKPKPTPKPEPPVVDKPVAVKPVLPKHVSPAGPVVVWKPIFRVGKVLFSDDFDSDSSRNWMIERSSADTAAKFSYNYSEMGIPPAPGSKQTLGLQLAANMVLPKSKEAVCLSPANQNFTGNYRLKFNLWMNANGPFPQGGVGSTQFFMTGAGTDGKHLHRTGDPTDEDGIWFTVNGDGDFGSKSDFTAYKTIHPFGPTTPGIYAAGTDDMSRANTHSYYAATFPSGQRVPSLQATRFPRIQKGELAVGCIGMAWRTVEIIKMDGRVTWIIDGLPVASVDFDGMPFGNNVFIGYSDQIDSVAEQPELVFAVVDNLVVEEIKQLNPE